jgi:hypothetical protein
VAKNVHGGLKTGPEGVGTQWAVGGGVGMHSWGLEK